MASPWKALWSLVLATTNTSAASRIREKAITPGVKGETLKSFPLPDN
jgi:hypothetical protein